MKRAWLVQQLDRLPRQARGVLVTALYAVGAAGAAVAFHLGIQLVYRVGIERWSTASLPVFLGASFLIVVGTSLVVGWLLSAVCREAAGSGIPQLKAAFWTDFGTVPLRVAVVKFVAGILSVGGGTSLGREGPSVQLSGVVGSNLAALAGEPKHKRRLVAVTGAAAGLAAAFNTPLAAVTFVLEEIIGDLNSRLLGSVLLASVIGAFVAHGLIGKHPAFTLSDVSSPTALGYLLTPVVAALAALVGVLFQRASLDLRLKARDMRLPVWARPALGGLITWALGGAVFAWTGRLGVFSLGYDDLSAALRGEVGAVICLVLLVVKLVATFASYGLGGCGGIFSPTLFFGAMTGAVVAGVAGWFGPVGHADLVTLMVVGMSATLGAVVRAPVTGILIVFEMTHEFALVPALMLAALVSQLIGRRFLKHNFYEEVLHQDGVVLDRVMPPRDLKGWQSLPVSSITNFSPATVSALDPASLRETLARHRFACFPVTDGSRLVGILSRGEIEAALREGRPPRPSPAAACQPGETVRHLQRILIESRDGLVGVVDRTGGRLLGVVTLHDLLRAEVAAAEAKDDDGTARVGL